MADSATVFRGVYSFCFDFPESEKYGIIRLPGFAAVWTLDYLEVMQRDDAPDFPYAQAIAVSKTEGYGFRDGGAGSVLAYSDAVRWVLCFPVVRRSAEESGRGYVVKTSKIDPLAPVIPRNIDTLCGEKVFFCFSSAIESAPNGKTFRAASSLCCLDLLSPKPGDKLVLVRASRWRWAKFYNTAVIKPKYVLDAETVSDSEVRMIDSEERERDYEWDCG
jgi:hypothetical protein